MTTNQHNPYDNQDLTTAELVVISEKDFIKKKNALKRFSAQLSKKMNLPTVPTKAGPFGLFDYGVTGEDLKGLIEGIQQIMIEQNKTVVEIIKEFNTIYEMFSASDKEYVLSIIFTLDGVIKANKKANENVKKIEKHQSDISGAQQDIKQVIGQQKLLIQALKQFKEKLEKQKHLYDIDKLFSSHRAAMSQFQSAEEFSAKLQEMLEQTIEEGRETARELHESRAELADVKKEITSIHSKYSEVLGELSETKKDSASLNSGVCEVMDELNNLRNDYKGLSKTLFITRALSCVSALFTATILILWLTGVLG